MKEEVHLPRVIHRLFYEGLYITILPKANLWEFFFAGQGLSGPVLAGANLGPLCLEPVHNLEKRPWRGQKSGFLPVMKPALAGP
jgi:hypothetical protein